MSKTLSGWAFQFRRARRSTGKQNNIKLNLTQLLSDNTQIKKSTFTILCEFGGAEYGGDPEGFFGASLEWQVGRQVGAAVEVLLAAGQTEVQALVTEGGVFITLVVGEKRGKK